MLARFLSEGTGGPNLKLYTGAGISVSDHRRRPTLVPDEISPRAHSNGPSFTLLGPVAASLDNGAGFARGANRWELQLFKKRSSEQIWSDQLSPLVTPASFQ